MLRKPEDVGHNVTIGPPMSNTTLYILDGEFQPAPVGVPGDLYIGGDGNARGYLAMPDLTAECFGPNPHGGPGERIYRTGDVARWLPDGTAEVFLGRRDFQVKIRGFRVELGEIESVLASHPDVAKAIVLVQEEPSGKRLAACVQVRTGAALEAEALRAHLRARLPEFMVPAAFVLLASIPLTAHNKVDRAALRALVPGAGPAAGVAYVAPRSPAEEVLAKLLGGRPAAPAGGRLGQLLRPRGPLAPGDAAALARVRGVSLRPADPDAVRRPDPGGFRRGRAGQGRWRPPGPGRGDRPRAPAGGGAFARRGAAPPGWRSGARRHHVQKIAVLGSLNPIRSEIVERCCPRRDAFTAWTSLPLKK